MHCALLGVRRARACARGARRDGRRTRPSTTSRAMPSHEALAFFATLELAERERLIAERVIQEIRSAAALPRSTSASTTSRSTARRRRSRAARRSASGWRRRSAASLVGVLYVLDEPSIGLHQRDNARLIATLERLRDIGNTVLVVEHDEETMRAADTSSTSAPAPACTAATSSPQGTPDDVAATPRARSPGQYLAASCRSRCPRERRRRQTGKSLKVVGAREHNLKDIDVEIPLGRVRLRDRRLRLGQDHARQRRPVPRAGAERCYSAQRPSPARTSDRGPRAARQGHRRSTSRPSAARRARTPRPTSELFDAIRELFAQLPEARMRGYKPGRFSFNVKGGRCEACQGDGDRSRIEMQFLRRRLGALRGLRRQALQPRDARDPLQGQEHRATCSR